MSDRVSNDTQFRSSLAGISRAWTDMYRSQLELSTGRRIRKPSDDPTGASRLMGIDRAKERLSRYGLNISSVSIGIEATSRELQAFSDLYSEARQRVVQGLNGTLDAGGRRVLADDLDRILGQMLTSANTQESGQYLFGGSETGKIPYVRNVGTDGIERITYQGDARTIEVPVADGVSEVANFPGSRVFRAGNRTTTTFLSKTGAQPGVGTNSATGTGRLMLSHTQTTFGAPGSRIPADPLSGLRLGASSATLDTVLGAGHTLDVAPDPSGIGGTVSLNGGPDIPFGPTDANLAVEGPDGSIVHLDFRSVLPGFSGLVPISGDGTVSADGGRTVRAIDFTATGMQVRGPDGGITHLDATGIRRAGAVDVRHNGTFDVFSSLIAIRDALRVEGDPATVTAAMDHARVLLGELDTAQEGIQRSLADSGSVASRLEATTSRLEDFDILLSDRRSKIADVDLSDVLVRMKEQEAVYQSALYVSSRLGQLSLLNFLA
jgi:flagellar hook-associated protein 3 FlgL